MYRIVRQYMAFLCPLMNCKYAFFWTSVEVRYSVEVFRHSDRVNSIG